MSFVNLEASDHAREAHHGGTAHKGGGSVRNDLSTALVGLYRELFGRGPVTTTTYAFDAGYVTFLRDILVPHERVLVIGGRTDLVTGASGYPRRRARAADR